MKVVGGRWPTMDNFIEGSSYSETTPFRFRSFFVQAPSRSDVDIYRLRRNWMIRTTKVATNMAPMTS